MQRSTERVEQTIEECLADFTAMARLVQERGMNLIMSNLRLRGVVTSEDHLERMREVMCSQPIFSEIANANPVFKKVSQITVCSGSKNLDSETLALFDSEVVSRRLRMKSEISCIAMNKDPETAATCDYISNYDNTISRFIKKMGRKRVLDSTALKADQGGTVPKKGAVPSEELASRNPNTVQKVSRGQYECGYVATVQPNVRGNLAHVPNLKLGIPEAVAVKSRTNGIVQLHHKQHITFQIPNYPNTQSSEAIAELYHIIRQVVHWGGAELELSEDTVTSYTDKVNTERVVVPAISALDEEFALFFDYRREKLCIKKVTSESLLREKLVVFDNFVARVNDVRERLLYHKSDIGKVGGQQLADSVFSPLHTPGHTVFYAVRGYVRGFLCVLRQIYGKGHCLDDRDSFFMNSSRSSFSRLCDYIVDSCVHVFVSICLALAEKKLKKRVPVNNYEKAATVSFMVFLTMVFEHHTRVPEDESYPSQMCGLYSAVTAASATRAREVAATVARDIAQYFHQSSPVSSQPSSAASRAPAR